MRPLSGEFKAMTAEVERLRWSFLPPVWSPTGNYDSSDYDKVQAFRLLVHAEFEHYIEEVIRTNTDRVVRQWKHRRRFRKALFFLTLTKRRNPSVGDCFAAIEALQLRRQVTRSGQVSLIDRLVDDAWSAFSGEITKNNGIRIGNLEKLLLPIGIDPQTVDAGWLPDMDSFGKDRGSSAHSSKIGLSALPDPKGEWQRVSSILLPGLKNLDQLVCSV